MTLFNCTSATLFYIVSKHRKAALARPAFPKTRGRGKHTDSRVEKSTQLVNSISHTGSGGSNGRVDFCRKRDLVFLEISLVVSLQYFASRSLWRACRLIVFFVLVEPSDFGSSRLFGLSGHLEIPLSRPVNLVELVPILLPSNTGSVAGQ